MLNISLASDVVRYGIVGGVVRFELPTLVSASPSLLYNGKANLLELIHEVCGIGHGLFVCIVETFGKYLIDYLVFA